MSKSAVMKMKYHIAGYFWPMQFSDYSSACLAGVQAENLWLLGFECKGQARHTYS